MNKHMALSDKSRLRNTLKKLSRLAPGDGDPQPTAQEALDFLAMMAGIKPVMLLGRGYNDPMWIKGVLQIAADSKLHIVEGPYWDASADAGAGADLPDWYLDHARHAFAEHRAYYICRARSVADEVAKICETAAITVAEEARLLHYPDCCVRAHYFRAAEYQGIWLDLLRRKAGGDAIFIACDVSQPEQVRALHREIMELFGRLDVACNNAGIEGEQAPTAESSLENFDRVISINLRGLFVCMQEQLKIMQKQNSGAIANLASVAGLIGFGGLPEATRVHILRGREFFDPHAEIGRLIPEILRRHAVESVLNYFRRVDRQQAQIAAGILIFRNENEAIAGRRDRGFVLFRGMFYQRHVDRFAEVANPDITRTEDVRSIEHVPGERRNGL